MNPAPPNIVAVVQDGDTLAEIAAALRSEWPQLVLTSTNGTSGLKKLFERLTPDVIIADDSPSDCLDMLHAIRCLSPAPVIMLSFVKEPLLVVRLLEAGASDYLTKPINTAEFLARVKKQLRHAATTRERT